MFLNATGSCIKTQINKVKNPVFLHALKTHLYQTDSQKTQIWHIIATTHLFPQDVSLSFSCRYPPESGQKGFPCDRGDDGDDVSCRVGDDVVLGARLEHCPYPGYSHCH